MVHARAFGFTDDAINVAFPSSTGMGRIPSASGLITGPQSADPALLLFQLRRTQSHWYQYLFQSDPTPLPDAASYIWQMCLEMREWGELIPDDLPKGIRELFDLELRYSYVYCIAPSARAPHMTDYGRTLIFEHAMAYLNAVHVVAHGALNAAFYTYHDALKVYFMGTQMLTVLRDAEDVLLSGAPVPIPPTRPGTAPPPPLPLRQGGEDNLTRSLYCLERVPATLRKFGERWEDSLSFMDNFETISADLLERLRSRKRLWDAAREQQLQAQQLAQQQQQQLQQQLQIQQAQMQQQIQQQQLQQQQQQAQQAQQSQQAQQAQQMQQMQGLQGLQGQQQQQPPRLGETNGQGPGQGEVRWVAQMFRGGPQV